MSQAWLLLENHPSRTPTPPPHICWEQTGLPGASTRMERALSQARAEDGWVSPGSSKWSDEEEAGILEPNQSQDSWELHPGKPVPR